MGRKITWLTPFLALGLMSNSVVALDITDKYAALLGGSISKESALVAFRADYNLYAYALQRMLEREGKYNGSKSGLLTSLTISALNSYCLDEGINCVSGPLAFVTMKALSRDIAVSINEEIFDNDPTMLPAGWAVLPAEGVAVDILRTDEGIRVTLSGTVEQASSTRVFVGPPRSVAAGEASNDIYARLLEGDLSSLAKSTARLQGVSGGDMTIEVGGDEFPILDASEQVTVSATVLGEGRARVRPLVILRHKPGTDFRFSVLLSAS